MCRGVRSTRRRSKPETAPDFALDLFGVFAPDFSRDLAFPISHAVAVEFENMAANRDRRFAFPHDDSVSLDLDGELVPFVNVEQPTCLGGDHYPAEVVDFAGHARFHGCLPFVRRGRNCHASLFFSSLFDFRCFGPFWISGASRIATKPPSRPGKSGHRATTTIRHPVSSSVDPKHVLVAVAWPYAQGSLHLGHIAGSYLPPDIFARYHRAIGNRVLMVSGSDVHGTPIAVKADAEGVTPQEIVDRYHPEFLGYWRDLGIQFDLFTTTGTETHKRVAQQFFLRLLEQGYLYRHVVEQFYDEEQSRFLPDRFIEGTCPHCGYEQARGDQCDNCGRTLDPTDLIDPRSKLSDSTPVLRETEHYYWRLSEFSEPLLEWLETREGWRPHVLNFSLGMVAEGLHDRSFTRDLEWGIPLPVDDLGPGKSIYVWWEAVMGYFSAPQEWAEIRGQPDAWKAWWEDPAADSYYFMGKDNVPFHAIYWPALLMGHGGLNLPTDVPANQYLTIGGEKASKSRGVGRSLRWYIDHLEPDALRYAVASNFPETSDTDLFDEEIERRINGELVANWGNLVNRVVSMTHRYFGGVVPEEGDLDSGDEALLDSIDGTLEEVGDLIARVKLRSGLATAMASAQEVNQYLSSKEPWKTAADDPERTGTTLWVTLNAISGLAAVLGPYLPFTTRRVLETLGVDVPDDGPRWKRVVVTAGTELGAATPLYAKVELDGDVEPD